MALAREASRLAQRTIRTYSGMAYSTARQRILERARMRGYKSGRGKPFRLASRYNRKRKRTYRRTGATAPGIRTRARRSRYRRQLGRRYGAKPIRRHMEHVKNDTANGDKTMYMNRLVKIPYSDDDTLMNVRKGTLCDVSGVKMRHWFVLKGVTYTNAVTRPIQVRWAVVNPKENDGLSTFDITKFFVNPNPGTDEAVGFKTATSTTSGNAFEYMNRKINRREIGVIQEGTFTLNNDNGVTAQSQVSMQSQKLINIYIPVNRQMSWADNTAGSAGAHPEQNLYFVWWYCQLGDAKENGWIWAGDTDANTPISHQFEKITYFRNARILY